VDRAAHERQSTKALSAASDAISAAEVTVLAGSAGSSLAGENVENVIDGTDVVTKGLVL
jgi:hypothetical protein